jgi:ABC-2 type transport system ATP-binding protein
MEESQELSDRVGIIDHGEIIAMGTVGELVVQVGEQDRLVFDVGSQTIDEALLRQLESTAEGITNIVFDPPGEGGESADNVTGQIIVYAQRGRKAMPLLIQTIANAGIEINSVQVRESDLEAVFLHLTGRALRD